MAKRFRWNGEVFTVDFIATILFKLCQQQKQSKNNKEKSP